MYALKRKLKLNNKQVSEMRGMAGFRRFVYNFGASMLKASWSFEGLSASDSVRLNEIKKVFTNNVMTLPEYAWTRNYSSTIYQSAFQALGEAITRWRKGLAEFPVLATKKKRWVESNLRPENWDDAILKVEQILYGEVGRPKKLKVTEEISKIVEISEWCKTRKPSKTTYQHNKQVAEAAKLEGLPEISPRTVGRVLKDNKNQKLILDVSNL